MLIERGMKFKVEVLKNPLINTKVGYCRDYQCW